MTQQSAGRDPVDGPKTEAGRALVAQYGVRPDSRFAQSVRDIEDQAVSAFTSRLSAAEAKLNKTADTVEVIKSIRLDAAYERLVQELEADHHPFDDVPPGFIVLYKPHLRPILARLALRLRKEVALASEKVESR